MRCFFVSEMKSKEQYERFMEYLLLHSEYFSVIYSYCKVLEIKSSKQCCSCKNKFYLRKYCRLT